MLWDEPQSCRVQTWIQRLCLNTVMIIPSRSSTERGKLHSYSWYTPKCLCSMVLPAHRGHSRAGRQGSSKPWVCSHVWIPSRTAEEATWLCIHSIKPLLQTRKWTAWAHSPYFVLLKLLAGQMAQEDLSSPSETWTGWLPLTHLSTLFPRPISLRITSKEDENIPIMNTMKHCQPARWQHMGTPSIT